MYPFSQIPLLFIPGIPLRWALFPPSLLPFSLRIRLLSPTTLPYSIFPNPLQLYSNHYLGCRRHPLRNLRPRNPHQRIQRRSLPPPRPSPHSRRRRRRSLLFLRPRIICWWRRGTITAGGAIYLRFECWGRNYSETK